MDANLAKYTAEELLLIYKNQSRHIGLPNVLMFSSDYDDYYNYYNYDNYDNYNNYQNYGDYSNYDQYSDSGGCFITTAVCNTFGKSDDCRELMAFRGFRDSYMTKNNCLKQEVEKYYEIAPKICKAIDAKGKMAAENEYAMIWENYLSFAYDALEKGELNTAYEIYKNMVLKLEDIYLLQNN